MVSELRYEELSGEVQRTTLNSNNNTQATQVLLTTVTSTRSYYALQYTLTQLLSILLQ